MSKIDDSITYDVVYLLQSQNIEVTDALYDQIKEIVTSEVIKLEDELFKLDEYNISLEHDIADLEHDIEDLENEIADLVSELNDLNRLID